MWCNTQAESLHDIDVLSLHDQEHQGRKMKKVARVFQLLIRHAKELKQKGAAFRNLKVMESEQARQKLRRAEARTFCMNVLQKNRNLMLKAEQLKSNVIDKNKATLTRIKQATFLGTFATVRTFKKTDKSLSENRINSSAFRPTLLLIYPEIGFDEAGWEKGGRSELVLQAMSNFCR